jgi:hypothetical protein
MFRAAYFASQPRGAMKTLSLKVLAVVFTVANLAVARGVPVDAHQFVESIQGSYEIELAGGSKPKEENKAADVYADAEEGILTLPFCATNSGLCDPGYISLAYPDTQVERETLSGGVTRYQVSNTINGKVYRYTWEVNLGRVTFTNHQYVLGNQVTTLQHVLRKL